MTKRPSLARVIRDVHSSGLAVHSVEVTPDGYRLTTAPRLDVSASSEPADALTEARETRRRAREAPRPANRH